MKKNTLIFISLSILTLNLRLIAAAAAYPAREPMDQRLYTALTHNDLMQVQLLINGATHANINAIDQLRRTPLIIAVGLQSFDIANFLLTRHASINESDNQDNTALLIATRSGHRAIIQLLLEHDAETDPVNNQGNTVLHLAAQNNHTNIIRLLLQYNANKSHKNRQGLTAYDIAKAAQNQQAMQLLYFGPERWKATKKSIAYCFSFIPSAGSASFGMTKHLAGKAAKGIAQKTTELYLKDPNFRKDVNTTVVKIAKTGFIACCKLKPKKPCVIL